MPRALLVQFKKCFVAGIVDLFKLDVFDSILLKSILDTHVNAFEKYPRIANGKNATERLEIINNFRQLQPKINKELADFFEEILVN